MRKKNSVCDNFTKFDGTKVPGTALFDRHSREGQALRGGYYITTPKLTRTDHILEGHIAKNTVAARITMLDSTQMAE